MATPDWTILERTLTESLDEMLQKGSITPDLAGKVSSEFENRMAEGLGLEDLRKCEADLKAIIAEVSEKQNKSKGDLKAMVEASASENQSKRNEDVVKIVEGSESLSKKEEMEGKSQGF